MEMPRVEELLRSLMQGLPPGLASGACGLREDLENNFRAVLRANLGKLDLAGRDEFDAQRKVLERTRARLEELEKRVAELEAERRGTVGPQISPGIDRLSDGPKEGSWPDVVMGVARVASRAQLGLARAARRSRSAPRRRPAHILHRRPARHRGEGEQGPRACGARELRLRISRRAASPSISRPPICPRKAAATTCRSRSASCSLRRRCRVPEAMLDAREFYGELGLAGELRPISGVLLAAAHAAREGRAIVVPSANAPRRASRRAAAVRGAASLLRRVRAFARRGAFVAERRNAGGAIRLRSRRPAVLDLADVRGQAAAKRALMIAAAGGHSLLLVGPPGTGKSMLAQRLPGLLPPLEGDEALDVASIASVSSARLRRRATTARRPFRAPHHTASAGAIIGGGPQARPGEVSLAHRGVLFLDELPEFNRRVLESLREPLESRRRRHLARRAAGGIPGALPARGRDESLPVRLSRRCLRPLPLRAAGDRALPRAHLRAAARSHRPARGGAGAAERRVVGEKGPGA